ncbi:Casein kinase II subunit alpha' [Lachnellula willkommii]|uniref:EKC/KEOPS complex subunit BUD32 n=1 Tax=Lachnellula willkommii TaxID=215461 RepID=A0A559M8X0_9HELO|nr:Casein kinase II subunit alpha' [Lachnellula willkommii]
MATRTMIKPEERFFSDGGGYFGPLEDPKSECFLNVWDWDQLRMVKLKGTSKIFPPDENHEIRILAQFADYLSPEVRAVSINDDGLITGVSTDPEEDETFWVPYFRFATIPSLADCRTIQYSKLQELGRFGPNVDLSSYEDESGNHQTVAFKFNSWFKPKRMQMAWDELHLLKSLPPHPNLLRLDRVVLDDVESRVIGFTIKYIPGGTLETSKVPFRFEWLQQLTQVVDFLNLDLGIMHQDIAPRNLLIDPDTHKLVLFDFNFAACGKTGLNHCRDDVSGVVFTLYELITNDTHFTRIPHWDRNIDMVQSISEWPCNRELDSDVSVFRNFLNEWVARRRSDGDMERYLNAPNQLAWPDLPTPPEYNVPYQIGEYPDGKPYMSTGVRTRRTAMKLGQFCFRWEREPQSRLLKKEEGENAT